MQFQKQVNWQTHTAGDGLWSKREATVRVTEVWLNYVNDEDDEDGFGELCVRFSTADWDISSHGLIYTDKRWIGEFRALMKTLGFSPVAVDDIDYSEAGMQGADYVSMDVGEDFLREVEPMYRWTINKQSVTA